MVSADKLGQFVTKVTGHFRAGEFALGFHHLTRQLPHWLIRFNKATILSTETHEFKETWDPNIHTRVADKSDVEDIERISGVGRDHVKRMMDRGAVCFISSIGNDRPAGVTWSANGACYVRGLAFYHDVGPNGYYGYGTVTLPEVRGRGLYMKAKCDKVKYQTAAGAKRFYATIEFTNTYSYSLQIKQGYYPVLYLTYLKLFCVKMCMVKDAVTGKCRLQARVAEPRGKVIII